MKIITNCIILLCFPILITGQSITMDIISNSGSKISSNQALEWTIGELMVQNFQNNETILSQGFHQGKLIITDITETDMSVNIQIYPNPTVSNIIIEQEENRNLSFKLYNLRGQFILSNNLSQSINYIDLEHIESGTYILHIFDNLKSLKSFKIQKIN